MIKDKKRLVNHFRPTSRNHVQRIKFVYMIDRTEYQYFDFFPREKTERENSVHRKALD